MSDTKKSNAMQIAADKAAKRKTPIRGEKRQAFRVDAYVGGYSRAAARDPLAILLARG